MQRNLLGWLWVGILVALGLGAGCTALQPGAGTPASGAPYSGTPYSVTPSPAAPSDWTMATTGAYMGAQGRVFYAIGDAGGMHNATLLRATADNQAQKEMSRLLDAYVRALAQAAGPDSEGQPLYIVVKAALQKAHIVDHRQGESGLRALCRLELSVFKQVLAAEGELDPELRKRMLAQADRVHAELSAASKGF